MQTSSSLNELAPTEMQKAWTQIQLHHYLQALDTALTQQLNLFQIAPHSVIATYCSSRLLLTALIQLLPKLGLPLQPLPPIPTFPHKGGRSHTIKALLDSSGASVLIADTVIEGIAIPIIKTDELFNNMESVTALKLNSTHQANTVTLVPTITYNGINSDHDIQLIIATSGSEGIPKSVMLTQHNLAAAVIASCARIPLNTTDLWLCCLPLYHIGGIAILYRCAYAGATMVMLDSGNGTAIAQALEQHACTHVSLVPAMLARLLEVMPNPPSSLKYALIGGSALNPQLAQRALAQNWPLCISYGMSETGSQCATLCNPKTNWPGHLVGLPLPEMQIRINKTGRIQLRGPMVMAGYANPQRQFGSGLAADGWFSTSDLGYLDENGQLWVTGRADQVLISGGVKIDPVQLEILLQNCLGINEIAVSGHANAIWGEIVVAVFAGTIEPGEFAAWCREHISSAMRPREFVKVTALPRTSLEKIDRAALRVLIKSILTSTL